MALTLKQHKIAALKYARKAIAEKRCEYICIALGGYPESDYGTDAEAVRYLKKYIQSQLNPECALDHYLEHKEVIKSAKSCWSGANAVKIRQTRLNWIDWMLEIYEGDK